eukprot:tig00000572_g2207.t1
MRGAAAAWVCCFMLLLVAETLTTTASLDSRAWTLRGELRLRRPGESETPPPVRLVLGLSSWPELIVKRLRDVFVARAQARECRSEIEGECPSAERGVKLGIALQLQSAAAVLNAFTLAVCCAILCLADDAVPLLAASCLGSSFFSLLLTIVGLLTWQHSARTPSGAKPPALDFEAVAGPGALRVPGRMEASGWDGGGAGADAAAVALGTLMVLYSCFWTLCLLATARPRPEEPPDADPEAKPAPGVVPPPAPAPAPAHAPSPPPLARPASAGLLLAEALGP